MELALDTNKRYTYADYLTWLDNKVRELFDGFVRLRSPAPSAKHQELTGEIYAVLLNRVKKHKGRCKVYTAPFDVRLPKNGETEDDKIYTVVQPDVCVVCDPAKIDRRGCLGAPDLVVDVQSLSTAKHDLDEKFHIYERAGVREYWVVSPYADFAGILKFVLQPDGKYDQGTKYETGEMPIEIFPNETINISEIFPDNDLI
jgi:Uma2 family endonuclease